MAHSHKEIKFEKDGSITTTRSNGTQGRIVTRDQRTEENKAKDKK